MVYQARLDGDIRMSVRHLRFFNVGRNLSHTDAFFSPPSETARIDGFNKPNDTNCAGTSLPRPPNAIVPLSCLRPAVAARQRRRVSMTSHCDVCS